MAPYALGTCCICGESVGSNQWWVCCTCADAYDLRGKFRDWPDWAKMLARDWQQQRRLDKQGAGDISLDDMATQDREDESA